MFSFASLCSLFSWLATLRSAECVARQRDIGFRLANADPTEEREFPLVCRASHSISDPFCVGAAREDDLTPPIQRHRAAFPFILESADSPLFLSAHRVRRSFGNVVALAVGDDRAVDGTSIYTFFFIINVKDAASSSPPRSFGDRSLPGNHRCRRPRHEPAIFILPLPFLIRRIDFSSNLIASVDVLVTRSDVIVSSAANREFA